jgi:hypothetical protein
MTEYKNHFTKSLFHARCILTDGSAFQDLFYRLMLKTESGFTPIKPQGRLGDMKNDGYIPSRGIYFQVYAPEDIKKATTVSSATKKLKTDFEGLFKKWDKVCKIREFYFVVNDKSKGIPVALAMALNNLEQQYKDIKFGFYKLNNLIERFETIPIDERDEFIGYIPNESTDFEINYEKLYYVLDNVKEFKMPSIPGKLIVPDFDNKLEYNGLCDYIKGMLRNANYSTNQLHDFFKEQDQEIEKDVCEYLHSLYLRAKDEIGEDVENSADCRFFYMLNKICPDMILPSVTTAMVLLSYYFESCDIFEEPIKEEK